MRGEYARSMNAPAPASSVYLAPGALMSLMMNSVSPGRINPRSRRAASSIVSGSSRRRRASSINRAFSVRALAKDASSERYCWRARIPASRPLSPTSASIANRHPMSNMKYRTVCRRGQPKAARLVSAVRPGPSGQSDTAPGEPISPLLGFAVGNIGRCFQVCPQRRDDHGAKVRLIVQGSDLGRPPEVLRQFHGRLDEPRRGDASGHALNFIQIALQAYFRINILMSICFYGSLLNRSYGGAWPPR